MMLSRIEVMACGGILLVLCLGGAVSGSDAPPADPAALRASADRLGLALVIVMPLALGLFVWRRWYDLGDTPRWSPAFSPPLALGMLVSMLLLGMGGAGIVQVLLGGTGGGELTERPLSDQALMLAGHVAAQSIVVAVFLWRSRTSPVQPRRPGTARAVLAGGGAYLLVWPLVATAAFASGLVVQRVTGEPPEPIAHDTLQVLVESPSDGWLILMVGLVVLAIPVLEEVMYRGMLQQALVEVAGNRWVAIVLASGGFTLMHWGAAQEHALPALFVLSVGFGWIYEKTGRLTSCIVMHILFNAVNLSVARFALPGA
jgi:membrane protease YdiL (CAAX protease family)